MDTLLLQEQIIQLCSSLHFSFTALLWINYIMTHCMKWIIHHCDFFGTNTIFFWSSQTKKSDSIRLSIIFKSPQPFYMSQNNFSYSSTIFPKIWFLNILCQTTIIYYTFRNSCRHKTFSRDKTCTNNPFPLGSYKWST